MLEGLGRLKYQSGDTIFKEDDEGLHAYLIESGSVEVSINIGGSRHRIAVLGKNELFGEIALIDNEPRTATVTALEETQVIELSKTVFESKLAKEDPVIQHLLLLVLKRFRNMQYQNIPQDKLPNSGQSKDTDKVFFESQKTMIDHIKLASELNEAIARNEFLVYYQPIISISNSRLVGFEALIRWQHPINGLLVPQLFLKFAESNGQIINIGNWILKSVCQDFKSLAREFNNVEGQPPLFISVNLSASQLSNAEEVAHITSIIHKHNINPASIKLEVTETALLEAPDTTQKILSALSSLGFKIVMDDFGTGFSSLSYLQKFSFDTIKIDQSFTKNMLSDSNSMQIVKASISLANAMNMDVIAEGVEYEEILNELEKLQCDYAQGYYIDKPMPLSKAIDFLIREESKT